PLHLAVPHRLAGEPAGGDPLVHPAAGRRLAVAGPRPGGLPLRAAVPVAPLAGPQAQRAHAGHGGRRRPARPHGGPVLARGARHEGSRARPVRALDGPGGGGGPGRGLAVDVRREPQGPAAAARRAGAARDARSGGGRPLMSGVSYEKEDADTRMVIRAGIVLALVTLVASVVVLFLFRWLGEREARGDAPPPPMAASLDPHRIPPGPRLQTRPAQDLEAVRAEEERTLTTYGWVD